MARLTEVEKRQLLEATRDRRPEAIVAEGADGALDEPPPPVATEVYLRQLEALARLPRPPKPVAFDGAYWRL